VNTASVYPAPDESLAVYLEQAKALRRRMEATLPADGTAWIFGVIEPGSVAALTSGPPPRSLELEQIAYPVSLLLYTLTGRQPVTPAFLFRQDWLAGERVVLRIPRRDWISLDSLPPVEIKVEGETGL
jgi:hypothetical protein